LSSFKITTLSKQSPVGRKFAQSGHPGFKVNHLLLVNDDLVEFCCLAVVEVMAGTDGAKLEKYDCVEKLGKIEIHFFVKKKFERDGSHAKSQSFFFCLIFDDTVCESSTLTLSTFLLLDFCQI
jgi:hypothetical protein